MIILSRDRRENAKISLLERIITRIRTTGGKETSNNILLSGDSEKSSSRKNTSAENNQHDNSGDCQCRIYVPAHRRKGRRVSAYERRCGQDHTKKEVVDLNRQAIADKGTHNTINDNNNSMNAVVAASMNLIASYEGFVPHAYFDSNGNLTTGYGTLIPSKEAYAAMDWQKQGHYLTNTQKDVNYDNIMALKAEYGSNRTASSQTKMKEFGSISQSEARIMAEEHIKNRTIPSIQRTLSKDGVDFGALPPSVQIALIDIGYNTGNIEKFPAMRAAIQKMDFETMAKESHRQHPVNENRNNDIRDLIVRGKQEAVHQSKYGTWE